MATVDADLSDFTEFLEIVRDLVVTADDVALDLHDSGDFKNSAKLYKSTQKLEAYLNTDGQKSPTH